MPREINRKVYEMKISDSKKNIREQYRYHYDSPLGRMTLLGEERGLTGLWFDGQRHFPEDSAEYEERFLPVFGQTVRWLDIYFSGRDPGFTPQLFLEGSSFRREVWDILLTIPYGRTMTYGQIAGIIAEQRGLDRMSAQAVGGAVGHNPVSLIVPCHRVVGAGGSLTGYAGGIGRKARLLTLEKAEGIFIKKDEVW